MSPRWPVVALAATLPVLAAGALAPGAATASPAPPARVGVVLTDLSSNTFLAPQPSLTWQAGPATAGQTITVDTTRRYQQITGFGASFTDSSA